jgi:hypothetical protein
MSGSNQSDGVIDFKRMIAERITPLLSPSVREHFFQMGLQFTVVVPEAVTLQQIESLFKDKALICVSRRFFGFYSESENSDLKFERSSSVFEDTFSLDQPGEGDRFLEHVFNKTVTSNGKALGFGDFLMALEIFSTNDDPNWSNVLMKINLHPMQLDVSKLLDEIKG